MISGKNKELYYASSIDKQLNIEVIGTKHVIDNSTRAVSYTHLRAHET